MCSMLGERIPCIVYVEFFRRSLWVRILQEENALHGKITRSVVREHLLCIYVRAYTHACAGMPFLHGLTAMVYVCVRVCGCRCTSIHHAYQHTHKRTCREANFTRAHSYGDVWGGAHSHDSTAPVRYPTHEPRYVYVCAYNVYVHVYNAWVVSAYMCTYI